MGRNGGIMMEEKYCQCCGMPMGQSDALYGLEADGSKSKEYCSYCYNHGTFTFTGTMEEMIEICIAPMLSSNPKMSESEAREMMLSYFPTLLRWQK